MRSAVAVALCGLLLSPFAFAKNKPEFQTAKVISQNIEPHQVDRGVMTRTPLVRYSNTVVVETADERMTWSEVATYATGTKVDEVVNAIPLPVHGTIQFYQDGTWYFVLDAAKKKHKFSLLHEEVIGK